MIILITGGSGFLGSYLALDLVDNYSVFVLLRPKSNTQRIKSKLNHLSIVTYESYTEIEKIIIDINPDVVLHTACNYGRKSESFKDIYDSNYYYGLSIFNGLLKVNKQTTFINFDTILNSKTNNYSFSKKQFAELGKFISDCPQYSIKFINVLLQHIYGPGDDYAKFSTYILKECFNNKNSIDLTDGLQERDFIYIEDVIQAIKILIENLDNIQLNEIEIGSGSTVTIRDFVLTISELIESKTKFVFGALDYRKNEIMYSKADITEIKKMGWIPKYNLKEGLIKTINKDFK